MGALDTIKKNKKPLLWGGGAVVAFFVGNKIKKELDRAKLHDDIKKFRKGNRGSVNIQEAVTQLGQDFGFEYASFDPRHWTENDDAARDLLIAIGRDLMPEVEKQYANRYSRSLQKDAQKYLEDDYTKVSYLFTGISPADGTGKIYDKTKEAAAMLKKFAIKQ